eukprot:jgi/Psemu1/39153/gm1.39153_g
MTSSAVLKTQTQTQTQTQIRMARMIWALSVLITLCVLSTGQVSLLRTVENTMRGAGIGTKGTTGTTGTTGAVVATTTTTVPRITEPWKKPPTYCYKGKNDWSDCAGVNLNYPATTPPPTTTLTTPAAGSSSALRSRSPFLCIHKPYCWKQLDWEHTDPPNDWVCPAPTDNNNNAKKKDLLFWDMNFHDSSMGEAAPLIEQKLNAATATATATATASGASHHWVELCNNKGSKPARRNYPYDYKECPYVAGGTEYLDGASAGYYTEHRQNVTDRYKATFGNDPYFRDKVSALIFSFSPSNFEFWIGLKKTLVLALWHVADKNRCTKETSQALFDKIRDLASDKEYPHIIGAYTVYHLEYIRHYTGLNPIFLPVTLLDALKGMPERWSQSRPEFLFNAEPNAYPTPPSRDGFTLINPKSMNGYEMADLTKYAGVVLYPYSISSGKFIEQYALEMPIFAPTPKLAATMLFDRTSTYWPYCPDKTAADHPPKHHDSPYDFDPNVRYDTNGEEAMPDAKFWAGFAEMYLLPCIEYFDSEDELFAKLESADRPAMSACMRQANKWRNFEELQNWCWATNYIQAYV